MKAISTFGYPKNLYNAIWCNPCNSLRRWRDWRGSVAVLWRPSAGAARSLGITQIEIFARGSSAKKEPRA